MIMRRTCARAPIRTYYTSWPARARIYMCMRRVYARVLSEPANKLVCGGLPHWESFVINLLGGNARTLYLRHCTEVETRRVSNLSGLFLRFLVRESPGPCAIYSAGSLEAIVCWNFHDAALRRRKMSLRYRITRRSIWNMAAASWRQIFMALRKGLQSWNFASNGFSILWQIAFESRHVSFTAESEMSASE